MGRNGYDRYMKGSNSEKDLLSVDDVAGHLGVGRATVWRWCREGRLPALKAGAHWRIRREALEDFLKEGERPATLVGQLGSFLRVPDNVLAVAQDENLLHRLDAAFFRVAEARGGLLVKFHSGEERSKEQFYADFEANGLEAGRLEREGRLLMRPEEGPLGGRENLLRHFLEDEAGEGRTVWASYDWATRVDLETVLEQQGRLTELVENRLLVVKTAALDAVADEWSSAALRRAQSSHAGTIFASEDGLSMSRRAPMPPS